MQEFTVLVTHTHTHTHTYTHTHTHTHNMNVCANETKQHADLNTKLYVSSISVLGPVWLSQYSDYVRSPSNHFSILGGRKRFIFFLRSVRLGFGAQTGFYSMRDVGSFQGIK